MSCYAHYKLTATGNNLEKFQEQCAKVFDLEMVEVNDDVLTASGMYNIVWDWQKEMKELCDETQTTIAIHWLCGDGGPHKSWESGYDPSEDEDIYESDSEERDYLNTITIVSDGPTADALAFYLYTLLREDEHYDISNVRLDGKTIQFDSGNEWFDFESFIIDTEQSMTAFTGNKIDHYFEFDHSGNDVADDYTEEQKYLIDEAGELCDRFTHA